MYLNPTNHTFLKLTFFKLQSQNYLKNKHTLNTSECTMLNVNKPNGSLDMYKARSITLRNH
jgi:hypothetical protein